MAQLTLDEREQVKKIVCGAVDVQPEELTDTSSFSDHGIGSVQAIEIITVLEDELDITINMSEVGRITSLEAVYDVVATAQEA
jgi:acyl carrier protein